MNMLLVLVSVATTKAFYVAKTGLFVLLDTFLVLYWKTLNFPCFLIIQTKKYNLFPNALNNTIIHWNTTLLNNTMTTQSPKKESIDNKTAYPYQGLLDKRETCILRVCIWNGNPRRNLLWSPSKRQRTGGNKTETGAASGTGIATHTTLSPKGEKSKKRSGCRYHTDCYHDIEEEDHKG